MKCDDQRHKAYVSSNETLLTVKEPICHHTQHLNIALYKNGHDIYAHWHDEWELIYVFQGTFAFYIHGEEYRVKEGNGLFVNRYTIHSCLSCEEGSVCGSIVYGDRFLFPDPLDPLFHSYQEGLKNYRLQPLTHYRQKNPDHKLILDSMLTIFKHYDHQGPFTYLLYRTQLLQIYYHLFTHNLLIPVDDAKQTNQERIRKAMAYMASHPHQTLSVAQLADHMTMSIEYFCRLFKENVGLTPKEYHVHCRITHSIPLLLERESKINEVAYACGYDDPNYYSRCFRKYTGLTPTAYKRRYLL